MIPVEGTDCADDLIDLLQRFTIHEAVEFLEVGFNDRVIEAAGFVVGIEQHRQDALRIIGIVWLLGGKTGLEGSQNSFILIIKTLLVRYRREELTCCVESLQFDLGLKPILSFHYHINHLEKVIVPFFDTPEAMGSTLVINDEKHGATTRTFLEHDQSANATITIFKGEDLFEAHMKIQNLTPFNIIDLICVETCNKILENKHACFTKILHRIER